MTVPYTFGGQSGPIPLRELDDNFASINEGNVDVIASGGITSISLAVRFGRKLTPYDFGAVGDGITDDLAALQAACNAVAAAGGGTVDCTGGRFLIDSADLLVPSTVFLIGPWLNFGEQLSVDYTSVKSSLVVNSSYTVRLNGDHSGVFGLVILKKGLTTPSNIREGIDLVNSFAGTGITVGDGTTNKAADVYLGYLFIAGFQYGIYSDFNERLRLEYISGDNTNGLYMKQCFDMEHVSHIHFWPFLTAHQSWSVTTYSVNGATNSAGLIRITTSSATELQTGDVITIKNVGGVTAANARWTVTVINSTTFDLQGSTFSGSYTSGGTVYLNSYRRTGIGIFFDTNVDWGQCDTCFTYGYDIGIKIMDCHYTTLVNCGTDNYAPADDKTTIGMWITGTSAASTLLGCKTAAQGYNLKIESSAVNLDTIAIVGHRSWGSTLYLAHFVDGTPSLSNCLFQTGGTIRVEDASGSPVFAGGDITGVSFSYASEDSPRAGFYSVVGATPRLYVVDNTDSASVQISRFQGHRASPANNDLIYQSYYLANSAGSPTEAARCNVRLLTNTSSAEVAQIFWGVRTSGTLVDELLLTGSVLAPVTSNGLALGAGTLFWSTAFLTTATLIDGTTAPGATAGQAKLYVDAADGDLKIVFGDGTVKTIVTD